MSATEATIERAVCMYAKKAGMISLKFISPGNRGVPDRIWINQYGEVYFVEFKAPKGVVSPLQQMWINRLRKVHKQVHVVRSVEEGKKLVDLLRDML